MFSPDKGTCEKSGRKDLNPYTNKPKSLRPIGEGVKIGLASDHGGFELKEKLKNMLKCRGYNALDFGTYSQDSCDYPKFGIKLIKAMLNKKINRGVLLCRSGIGFSILANRFKGIRAALCYNVKAAERSRAHNDSNILILGGDYIKDQEAKKILEVWLNTDFEGGRHLRRLKQIEKFCKGSK